MALSDLNRPKLKKYSHKGVSKKGGYVAKGQSRDISPSISNFGRSSNDPWLLTYRKHGILPVIELSGNRGNWHFDDMESALKNLSDLKTELGVGRTKFLEHLVKTGSTVKEAKTIYQKELKNLKSAQTLVENHRKSEFNEIAYADAGRMVDYIGKQIGKIYTGTLDDLKELTDEDQKSKGVFGLAKSLESWENKVIQAKNIKDRIDLGGMFRNEYLEDVGVRLGKTFDTKGELGGFRQKLAEKFRKSFFDPNITIINVPKRHKPGVVNYIPTPGGVTDLDAMGFTKNMQLRESKFIGISGDGKYNYPNASGLDLGMPGNTNNDILAKSYFPGPIGSEELHATGFTKFFIDKTKSQFIGISEDGKNYKYPDTNGLVDRGLRIGELIPAVNYIGMGGAVAATETTEEVLAKELHATGFTKFFIDKTKSQFVGISEDGKSYNYPVVVGPHQGTFRLGYSRTVEGLGNADSDPKQGVNYLSGIPGKWGQLGEATGTNTLPLGFVSRIGKPRELILDEDTGEDILVLKLPENSRSQLAYSYESAGRDRFVFGLGPPTSEMAPDSPNMWQLSSKSIIPDVPNTWDVRGQTMWDQMGEYPYAADTYPPQQSKGVNFMAGTKKGKTFNPEDELHPYGFTTNMGYIGTGVAAASKLAIPIDDDETKLKVSVPMGVTSTGAQEDANYHFPYPGQGSWYIGGLSLEDQLQSGVNFMYGAAYGKDVLNMPNFKTLHPKGFTPNMGKIKWDTQDADQYTGIASKLAIFPIVSGGSESDRGKLKISANLDGLDGYEFPMPGQGSWHIAKHWRRRHLPPKDAKGWVSEGYYDLNVPDSQANYPIWSNMTIDPTKESAEKATNSLSGIDQDSENITKLNTLIGASTYKVPRIGSEIARKFLHPTSVENSENKFHYVDHYWRWKDVYKIREEAAPGKMEKDRIHPIIYKTLMDMEGGNKETFRWSGATDRTQGSRQTIEFIRGGHITALNRITADQHRLKTLLHNSGRTGDVILGKQALLQALNPRKETRIFNPLSFEANALRVIKLHRHITPEGVLNQVWNTLATNIFNPIQNWLDPGSVSPVTLGVYERYEGYDWGDKNRRGKKNKLAIWKTKTFDQEESTDSWGKKLGKGIARGIVRSFTSLGSSLTGYNLEKDPDPPSRYVDSQKTLKGVPLKDYINPKWSLAKEQMVGQFKEVRIVNPEDPRRTREYKRTQGMLRGKDWGRSARDLDEIRVNQVGQQGKRDLTNDPNIMEHSNLGIIHTRKSDQVDKINAHRYGKILPEDGGLSGETVSDFIKFRFKDMVKGSNIVFRAILSGINDNITPEWSSERYIGRADQVHVYKGADRNISFNFSIAPKSKIELPILMEKLNYLIGLCYPDYEKGNNRMVPPMTQLTIGSILDEAPGFLNSLSYTVEESSPWEIQEGLQFPKFINVSCDFRYIGKNLPGKYGIHFGNKKSFYRDSLDIIDEKPEWHHLNIPGLYTGNI